MLRSLTGCALVLAACTAAPERTERTAGAAVTQLPEPMATAQATTPPPPVPTVAERPPPPPEPAPPEALAPNGPLAHFHAALRELEQGTRSDHARIVWLGDSHGQADFWSGHLRRALQERFGHGGPGFIHLGMKEYRHHGVRLEVEGSWRMRPKKPSQIDKWGDGRFGRGGILHAGFAGARWASIEITDANLAGRALDWDICFKPSGASDRFRLELGSSSETLDGKSHPPEHLHHQHRKTAGATKLRVHIQDGRPDFCGVTIETDPKEKAGVVLDNLAINGARAATVLAWDESGWADEMKRRPIALWIFEFGGNEASDIPSRPDRYARELAELVVRARRIQPEASCVVIGPAERNDKSVSIPAIIAAQKTAAAELGCYFWDTYAAMGGPRSMKLWQADGRASDDGIHLKPKGYEELGALLVADLLRSY